MSKESYTLIRDIPTGEVIRLDFKWIKEKNMIVDFSINVSMLEDETKIDIYRIDTNHGYLHEHKFWKSNKPEKLDIDYTKAFMEKKNEVLDNYKKWVLLFKKNR
jgi:hypothetical protein